MRAHRNRDKGYLDDDADTASLFGYTWGHWDRDLHGEEWFMVIRSHGQASDDPYVLYAQTHEFAGGCPDLGLPVGGQRHDIQYVNLYR